MSFVSAVEQSTAMETVTAMKMTHFMAMMTMMMILKSKIIESAAGLVMIVFDNLCGNIYKGKSRFLFNIVEGGDTHPVLLGISGETTVFRGNLAHVLCLWIHLMDVLVVRLKPVVLEKLFITMIPIV